MTSTSEITFLKADEVGGRRGGKEEQQQVLEVHPGTSAHHHAMRTGTPTRVSGWARAQFRLPHASSQRRTPTSCRGWGGCRSPPVHGAVRIKPGEHRAGPQRTLVGITPCPWVGSRRPQPTEGRTLRSECRPGPCASLLRSERARAGKPEEVRGQRGREGRGGHRPPHGRPACRRLRGPHSSGLRWEYSTEVPALGPATPPAGRDAPPGPPTLTTRPSRPSGGKPGHAAGGAAREGPAHLLLP